MQRLVRRFSNLSIAAKIPALCVCAATIAIVGVGVASYQSASQLAHEQAEERMMVALEAHKDLLQSYFQTIDEELRIVSDNPATKAAIRDFSSAWQGIVHSGANPTEQLQAAYITNNPNPTGEKDKLYDAEDRSLYSLYHAQYHPWLHALLGERGYYDIFLFDPEGNLVYTVFKELDYATNLNHGEWKDTDLGNAFRAAAAASEAGQTYFFDFKPYAPSHGAPASFMSTPVMDGERLAGVLVFQMPIDRINAVMNGKAGLGESGEVLLVGEDHLLRNDSEFTPESDVLATTLETNLVDMAIGGTAAKGLMDYRGMEMQVLTKPFNFKGSPFAFVVLAANDEINAPVVALRNRTLVIGAIVLTASILFGLFFSRNITRPITNMVSSMNRLAEGHHDIDLSGADRGDEIGAMAKAVMVFLDNAVERERLEGTQKEEMAARLAREERLRDLIAGFEASVGDVVSGIDSAANQMNDTAVTLNGVAGNARGQTGSAASASTEASTNVQTVASAAEELSASIGEISQQVARATEVVGQASSRALRTNEDVRELAGAAQKIGQVITLIQDIAEQTNLLALNATIEAARAGEAGRGFAVVANEVKALATQTAKATDEIAQQIEGIQGSTDGSVAAIGEITEIMEEVNSITSSIAAAVEQQSAATQEISRNIQEAASGTENVAQNVEAISGAIDETAQSAAHVQGAAGDLAERALALRTQIGDFLKAVAAA